MRILVANLGSTSFKCRLFEVTSEGFKALGKAGVESVTDYGAAIEEGLGILREQGALQAGEKIDAVGFKTVLGHNLSGCVEADETCLAALEAGIPLAPAHNPPYIQGIRTFQEKMPEATLVALFETAFYQWVSPAAKAYAVPAAWRKAGVQRHGFHGASHKFIAERVAALMGRDDIATRVQELYQPQGPAAIDPTTKPFRVISCHLGGSSSVTGVKNGVAIGTSMGLSPQSGLPQNNRVGEIDSMALGFAMRTLNLSLDEAERQLCKESGLLGLSGVSNDLRHIVEAADGGNTDAQLALDHFVHQIRHWVGSFWIAMGGCDALVFTAGIGENNPAIREAVVKGLEEMGLKLDARANASGPEERKISAEDSNTAVWTIPTNEELVVATEAYRLVSRKTS
jgi:acetate kinase